MVSADTSAWAIPGERGRLDRRVWRLAKHTFPTTFAVVAVGTDLCVSRINERNAGRETHPAATETVAIPESTRAIYEQKNSPAPFITDAGEFALEP